MKTIEILGPPGSGKTTVYRGIRENFQVDFRHHFDFLIYQHEIFKKLTTFMKFLPCRSTKLLSNKYKKKCEFELLVNFMIDNPSYGETIPMVYEAGYGGQKQLIVESYYDKAINYQIANETASGINPYIFDQGFYQLGASLLWRMNESEFNLRAYLESLPRIDLILFIDAPAELCINRQIERNNIVADKANDWGYGRYSAQQDYRRCCELIKNKASNFVDVIEIQNTSSKDDLFKQLIKELDGKVQTDENGFDNLR